MPQQAPLNVQEEFSALRKRFEEDPGRETFNALVLGELGTGKTHLLKTCRKPVLAAFFDPGGFKTLKDEIERGEVIPLRFEPDDPFKPWAFRNFTQKFFELEEKGLFNHIGTFALDSSTMFGEAILNYLTAKRGAAGKVPEAFTDYNPQKNEIRIWLNKILGLPCDVIVTGHLEANKDEVTGRIAYRYATTGKGTFLFPALFDEIYITTSEETSKGIKRSLLTASTGRYIARSRLAQNGKIEPYMPPNIKNILKLAGYPTEDKPLFK